MSYWDAREHLPIEEQYKKRTGREYNLQAMTDVTAYLKNVHYPGGIRGMTFVFDSCDDNLLYIRFSIAPLRFNYVLVMTDDGKYYTDAPLDLFLLLLAKEHDGIKLTEMTKEPDNINEDFLDPYVAYSILASLQCIFTISLDGNRVSVHAYDGNVRIEGSNFRCKWTLEMPTVDGVNLVAAILTQLVPYLPVNIFISKQRGQYRGAGYKEVDWLATSIHLGSEYGSSVIWSDKHKFFIRMTPKNLKTNIPGELSQEDKDLYMTLMEQPYEEDKMSDISDYLKNVKWKALCSNEFLTKGSDNILYFDFEYNYLTFRYVLVRKPDSGILTNAPVKTLKLIMPNFVDNVELVQISTNVDEKDRKAVNRVLLTATVGVHRLPFIVVLDDYAVAIQSLGDHITLTDVGTHDDRLLTLDRDYDTVDQGYYGAIVKQLAPMLPVTVKVQKCEKDYVSDKFVEKDNCLHAKTHFGVEDDKAVIWSSKYNMLVRMTPRKPTARKKAQAKDSAPVVALHEAIDLYCAQFKDGEFSKHIVEMLTALNVSETKVRKYLAEHTV